MITLNLNSQSNQPGEKITDDICTDLECVVKWFRQEEGYGFLKPLRRKDEDRKVDDSDQEILDQDVAADNDMSDQDIFIHASKLDPVQAPTLMPGDILLCKVVMGLRGPQVDAVYEYTPAPRDLTGEYSEGTIKWFNMKQDFGFIKSILDSSGKDVFLSGKKSRSLGIDPNDLKTSQKVMFTFKVDPRGNYIVDKLIINNE